MASGTLQIDICDKNGTLIQSATAADPALLDLAEVALPDAAGTALYDVVKKRIAIDKAGNAVATLIVRPREKPLIEKLPSGVMNVISAATVFLVWGAILLTWYLLSARSLETIGWAFGHADQVAFWIVFVFFIWLALTAKHSLLQSIYGFGAFGFAFLALVIIQVEWMGAADPEFMRLTNYREIGEKVLADREKWQATLAVYVPALLLLLRLLGFATAAGALEKFVPGKKS